MEIRTDDIKHSIRVLKSGGVIISPTDTLYGLLGSANNKTTVKKIYKIKSRRLNKPLIILINNINDILEFGIEEKWLNKALSYWQNANKPTTLVFPVINQKKIEYLHRGTGSLAIRLQNIDFLSTIINAVGPLVAPSANPEGLTPANNILLAKKYFGYHIDYYVDGGNVKNTLPSTIIDISDDSKIR